MKGTNFMNDWEKKEQKTFLILAGTMIGLVFLLQTYPKIAFILMFVLIPFFPSLISKGRKGK